MLWFKKTKATITTENHDGGVKIADILSPKAVKIQMEAADKDEAFEELVDLLVQTGAVSDREAALECVRQRETMGSTGIGNGVAIPHGKHASIKELVAALGIAPDGIEFGGIDGKPAKIIFLLLARVDNPGPHIQALAEIARLIQSPNVVERLIAAKTPEAVLDIIRAEE